MTVQAVVPASARNSGTSTSVENIVDELLIAIEQFVDAHGVETFRLAEVAPEDRLVVTLELDAAARRRLQLQDLADLERGDLAEVVVVLLEHGADGDPGALDLLAHLLGPIRVARARFARDDARERLAER